MTEISPVRSAIVSRCTAMAAKKEAVSTRTVARGDIHIHGAVAVCRAMDAVRMTVLEPSAMISTGTERGTERVRRVAQGEPDRGRNGDKRHRAEAFHSGPHDQQHADKAGEYRDPAPPSRLSREATGRRRR